MAINTVKLKFGYTNTDFTRQYTIENVADAALSTAKDKVLAINASLAGGTDGGLADFFRADDYNADDEDFVVGRFNRIVEAKVESVIETIIPMN